MDGGDYKPDEVHAANAFSEAARVHNTSRSSHACLILMRCPHPPKKCTYFGGRAAYINNFPLNNLTSSREAQACASRELQCTQIKK